MSKMTEEAARLAAAALDPQMLPTLSRRSPRLAMATVTDFTGELGKVEAELADTKSKLALHDGAAPTRKLSADTIKPSRFANRVSQSFEDPAFEQLKSEIQSAGGNVQPIKVRPIDGGLYEIVFGHRRHRACLELELPVLAMIESLSDKTLFEEMSRENEARKDLSPYEEALHYKRGIDAKLFKNWSEISAVLGKSKPLMSRYSALAELPRAVVDAFPSPNDIQPKWAIALRPVLDADLDAVVKAAKHIKGKHLSARAVFEALLNQPARKLSRYNFGGVRWVENTSDIKIEISRKRVTEEQLTAVQHFLKSTFGDS